MTTAAPATPAAAPAHSLVMASAGTGKTYQLTGRFIARALSAIEHETTSRPADLARILAATFTRKAAGEILHRILSRTAAACDDDQKRAELSKQVGRPLTAELCRTLLARIVRDLHRLNILTIDALFLRIAAAFGLELGVAPGWTICTEEDDADLRSDALDAALGNMDDRETLVLLEMLHGEGGKRSVRDSILRAVETIYSAFLLTEGRREIWERFAPTTEPLDADALPAALLSLKACPLPTTGSGNPHAGWANALARSIEHIQASDWQSFLKSGIPAKMLEGATDYNRHPLTDDVRAAFQPLIDHAAAILLREFHNQNIAAFELAAKFDRSYESLKAERGLFRFDDIPRLLIRADIAGNLEHLYYRLDSAISHILLDEFQDTSLTQFRLLAPLLDEILSSSDGRSVFIVGDVKQSLYIWRDAEPGLMPAMETRWPILAREGLDKSYRSSPVITGLVNDVFTKLHANPALQDHPSATQEWCARFATHSSAKQLKGAARIWVAPQPAGDDDDGPSQQVLTLQMAADRAREIHERAPTATIGILVRANKHIPRLVYELRQRGIQPSEEGGSPLLDAPAVAVAISLMQLADFPGDTAAAYHIANSPLGDLLGLSYPLSTESTCRISASLRRRLMGDGYARTLAWVQRHCAPHMDRRGFDRFEQLITLAQEFDQRAGTRPGEFVQMVQSRRIEDPSRQQVRVMSIHKSKGLEFDAVILPDLERLWRLGPDSVLLDRPSPLEDVRAATRYPSSIIRALSPELVDLYTRCCDKAVGEELCCLYVAMTRAIHSLDMIVECPKRNSSAPSAARVLVNALAPSVPLNPGSEIWRSTPYEDWTTDLKRVSHPVTTCAEIPLHLSSGSSSPAPRLRRRSPSALHAPERTSVGSIFSTAGESSRDAGTLLHQWFQEIEWAEDHTPDAAALTAAAQAAGLAKEAAQDLTATFTRALAGPCAEALRRARYRAQPADRIEVLRERAFEVQLTDEHGKPYTLRGQFDRLIVGYRNNKPAWADITDFKSDSISTPADRNQRTAHYTPQLRAYMHAVHTMYNLPPEAITASLLYIRTGELAAITPQ